MMCFFFFKQKTAYEMRISDWSSDVCSSDLHRRGAKGIGFDDVGARPQVLAMDIEHDVGANQRQKLVVALDVLGMVGKTRAAKISLGQFALLDHGAHRPIQDQYAFAEQARKFVAGGGGGKRRGHETGRATCRERGSQYV